MKINDIDFNVRIGGRGRPIVWGHGLTSSMDGEDALGIFKWNYFSDRVRIIRYDARGHGGTGCSYLPDHYHWKSLAEDMTAIADALHIDSYTAGGQSMGCATAIYSALKVPHRVEGLILANPPTAWEKRKAQAESYRKMAKVSALLGGKLLAKIAERRLRNGVPDWLAEAPAEKIRSMVEGLRTINRRTLSVLFKGAALTDLPPKDVIRSIDIPALVLAWTGDPGHPVEIAVELSELLPQSNLVVAEEFSDVEKWPQLIQNFILEKMDATDNGIASF